MNITKINKEVKSQSNQSNQPILPQLDQSNEQNVQTEDSYTVRAMLLDLRKWENFLNISKTNIE